MGGFCRLGADAAAKTTLDPVKLDPKHYKLVINNDQVRVLRAKYGPHEKSVTHEHPASVAVLMSDGQTKFTLPDGTSQDINGKAHDVTWADAGKHLPEFASKLDGCPEGSWWPSCLWLRWRVRRPPLRPARTARRFT